jgi:hypothetical protein
MDSYRGFTEPEMHFIKYSKFQVILSLAAVLGLILGGWQLARAQRDRSVMKDKKGDNIPVIVLMDNAPVYAKPGGEAAGRKANFLDQYFLFEHKRVGGKTYHLAGTVDETGETIKLDKIIGWFADDDVLTTREAMKQSGIYAKGLVVTRWDAGGGGGAAVVKEANLRKGPGSAYASNHEAKMYRFYYVFKTIKLGRTKYYLLGGSDTISDIYSPGDTLLGWISQDRLLEWNTRQAIEFDKSTLEKRKKNPAKIYATSDEVIRKMESDLAGVKLEKEIEPEAEEDVSIKEWSHDMQRFPLLEVASNTKYPEMGPIMKVGYIGDQIFMGDAKGTVKRHDVNRARQKLAKMMNSLNDLNICFVIDSTGSMRNYFAPAADAVKRIIKHVSDTYTSQARKSKSEDPPDVKFSVLFYRDYIDEEMEHSYLKKRYPYTANAEEIIRRIMAERRMICRGCGGKGDELEAMYFGIHQAIIEGEPEIDPNSHKVIILIGDNGNHKNDRMGYSAKKVAQILVDKGYEFFPIQVIDADRVMDTEGYSLFDLQVATIGDYVSEKTGNEPRRFSSKNPEKVARAIVEYAQGAIKVAVGTKKEANKVLIGDGYSKVSGNQIGLRIKRKLTTLMKQNNIDPEIFVAKGINPFGVGWIAETDPVSRQKQTKTMLLLERNNLDILISILAGLIKAGADRQKMLQTWSQVARDHLGESDAKISYLMKAHLGIPIRMNLLQRTANEIMLLPPMEISRQFNELKSKLDLLMCISQERRCAIKDGKVKRLGERKIWWGLPEQISQGRGEKNYGWIAADELP